MSKVEDILNLLEKSVLKEMREKKITAAEMRAFEADLTNKLNKSKMTAKHGGSFKIIATGNLWNDPYITVEFADSYTVMYNKNFASENPRWNINQFDQRGLRAPHYTKVRKNKKSN